MPPTFDRQDVPNFTVKRLIEKLESTSSASDVKYAIRSRRGHSQQNIRAVRGSVAENTEKSIRYPAQELNILKANLQSILHAYKVQLTQYSLPSDYTQRK